MQLYNKLLYNSNNIKIKIIHNTILEYIKQKYYITKI